MFRSAVVLPAVPRSRVIRWVSLLALGYIAGSALLVRDYIVQSRTADWTVHRAAGVSAPFAARR